MEALIINTIFGHVLGDFFFQSRPMSENKYKPGRIGIIWCTVHVLIYTFFVAAASVNFSPIFLVGVLVPHWIIDRWSLAYKWMTIIGRGNLLASTDYKEVSFGTIIYVTLDQTLHLGCLYILIKLT